MKTEGHIERNLLLLTAGALTIFGFFVASFFWVQRSLTHNQSHSKAVVAPVHSATGLLKSAFDELFNQQTKIASTETLAEMRKLGDRQRVEKQINDARALLSDALPKLYQLDQERGEKANQMFDQLDHGLTGFLESDQEFYLVNMNRRIQEERLVLANQSVEVKLKAFLEASQGISGKIRFAHGSSVRKAKRLVQGAGFNAEAQQLIRNKLLGPSNLQLSLVNEILSAAGELNRLSSRIMPARSEDQINTLIANELVQQRDKALINIQDLHEEVLGNPELEAITGELAVALDALSHDIMDPANNNSLVSLKFRVLAAVKEVDTIRATLERYHSDVAISLAQLVETSEGLSQELEQSLAKVVSWTRLILMFVLALALVSGAIGGFAVERSVKALRRNNADLSHLKSNLEKLVDERTKTIRTILDHVQFGFLLCDKDLKILEGSTRSCEQLLLKEQLTGMKLTDALNLNIRQGKNFTLQLSQLFDDLIPESVVFAQVPSRFTVANKTIRLLGSAVRDEAGRIIQVLYCLMDISDLEIAETENRNNRVLLNILRNPDQFRRFIADTHRGLNIAKTAIQNRDQGTLRRELHTIKGNLGVYELHDLARDIHQLEDQVEITLGGIDAIERGLARFLGSNFDILGISYEEKPTDYYRVSDRTLKAIEAFLGEEKNLKQVREHLTGVVADIRTKPAKDLMGPLDELTRNLAQRFGKSVVFKVEGEGIRMDPSKVQSIFNVLPHLIRNSIDHGIEFPWERLGKSADASLLLRFTEDAYSWTLTILDDGRGIDTDKLREKAIAAGIIKAQDKLSAGALNRLIFSANLSTADEVSDVSGRGVGMSAVAAAVKDMGCSIDVTSERGQGTRFEIIIPKKQRHLKSLDQTAAS